MDKYCEVTINSYNQTAKDYANKVRGICPMNELEKFVSYLPKKSKIADLGCGSGVAAKHLTEKGFYVTGIDLSESLLQEAKKESPESKFIYGDILNVPLDDNLFNGVWHVGSLLHIPRRFALQGLREVNRILKSDGIIYLSVKAGNSEGFEEDKRYGGIKKWWTYFDSDEINMLLEKSGFEILENYGVEYDDSYRNAHPWMNVFARKIF